MSSSFIQCKVPLRTRSMAGLYPSRQRSANRAQSTAKPFSVPHRAPSRMIEPRQSTTVPKTSKMQGPLYQVGFAADEAFVSACHAVMRVRAGRFISRKWERRPPRAYNIRHTSLQSPELRARHAVQQIIRLSLARLNGLQRVPVGT